jgi:hypothetical protein
MSYLFITKPFQREKFILFSLKIKNFKKPLKNIAGFLGEFFWVGFLLPTLIQAHSCPGQGKNETSSRGAWPISIILTERSQEIIVCCEQLEQAAGGGTIKTYRNSDIFKNRLKKL